MSKALRKMVMKMKRVDKKMVVFTDVTMLYKRELEIAYLQDDTEWQRHRAFEQNLVARVQVAKNGLLLDTFC